MLRQHESNTHRVEVSARACPTSTDRVRWSENGVQCLRPCLAHSSLGVCFRTSQGTASTAAETPSRALAATDDDCSDTNREPTGACKRTALWRTRSRLHGSFRMVHGWFDPGIHRDRAAIGIDLRLGYVASKERRPQLPSVASGTHNGVLRRSCELFPMVDFSCQQPLAKVCRSIFEIEPSRLFRASSWSQASSIGRSRGKQTGLTIGYLRATIIGHRSRRSASIRPSDMARVTSLPRFPSSRSQPSL
jgi:hypothetical protein